jgi:hypothetical protein
MAQLTLEVPDDLEQLLRDDAVAQGKTVEAIASDAVRSAYAPQHPGSINRVSAETKALLFAEARRRGQSPDELADALLLGILSALYDAGKSGPLFAETVREQMWWEGLPETQRTAYRTALQEGLNSAAQGQSRSFDAVYAELQERYGMPTAPRPLADIEADADRLLADMDPAARAALGF